MILLTLISINNFFFFGMHFIRNNQLAIIYLDKKNINQLAIIYVYLASAIALIVFSS